MELILDKINTQLDLDQCWQYAIKNGFSIAIWRLPNENIANVIINRIGILEPIEIDFDDEISGYCISEFGQNKGNKAQIIKNDIFFEFDLKTNKIVVEKLDEKAVVFLQKIPTINNQTKQVKSNIELREITSESKPFISAVEKAIEAIIAGQYKKIVLSRIKNFELDQALDIINLVQKLATKYSNAHISAVYIPEQACVWLGASPELLVSYNAEGEFKTVALAGTQNAIDSQGNPILANQARWSQKEIEEQALVSRYIIDCLKTVRVREFEEHGPKTVDAGNLLHLQTEYFVNTKCINFEGFATVMLDLLNPTSAVCGMPKIGALDFINKHETVARQYFSGFWGPKNINNQTAFYVNLRCMKITEKLATFYAGAGITEDSVPQNEWLETELKIQTLLNIVND